MFSILSSTFPRFVEANLFPFQRGGEGNVHKDKYGGHSGPQGVTEKVKETVEGKKS